MREVYTHELFPNRDQSSYNGSTSTLSVLNLAYYPTERGPYNFSPTLDINGHLPNPRQKWGGMMRKLDTNDFEMANIEYIEFWLLDPFIYSNKQTDANLYGGDFYINLGEVSEDILHDGKKFYESGMPVDGSQAWITTQWGKIPTQTTITYAFATTKGSRALQDVGFNGLNDEEERNFPSYQAFLTYARSHTNQAVFDSIWADPANDNYHYFRGSDWDRIQAPILQRYKYINNPQGNSPDSDNRNERYDTSYKSGPDIEDINQDYTLNEYEKYYQYKISIRPQDLVVGQNYIVDKRETVAPLRKGGGAPETWYQFRIPVREYQKRVGGISDFTSIRFMRMFLTNFEKPVVMRFATLDLVRGEWRQYQQNLTNSASTSGTMSVGAVSIEENNDKTPVNYVLPPGISREQDPSQPQLVQSNEQALAMTVHNLGYKESKAVYKNTTLDIRQYKRLQMFVHANALKPNVSNLADNQLAVFVRLGSDYKNNYYEYEIPLKLTPEKQYDKYSRQDCEAVWPEGNMLDVPISVFTDVKKQRNIGRGNGTASFNREFSMYDEKHPANRVSVMGNPTLGEIKTMIIGVRNLSSSEKSGEIWVNEMRLLEFNNEGGWAARGQLNIQLSDFGTVDINASHSTDGFGGLEQGVNARKKETNTDVTVTTSLELGKFFPDKAKVSAPLYYSVTKSESRPKYNPLDTDMLLDAALDGTANEHERDSIESIAVTKRTTTNFSLSNVRVGIQNKRHPMPYDPANFSFSYSHAHTHTTGETTVYENEDNWRGAMNYNWTPVYKSLSPLRRLIKSKSKWFDILKRFELNWLPQNVAFNTEITRNYYELQERDMEATTMNKLPLTFSEQFLWNRDFAVRWDLTRNLHINFQSATHAEIEEPYTPINKDLYADRYQAWKDSVWTSLKHFGTPLDYQQNFTLSYQLPLNMLPIFDWINSDATYNSTYTWVRGTRLESGKSLGNTITNNRTLNINGSFNLERLYNHIPFLKKTNERFNKSRPSLSRSGTFDSRGRVDEGNFAEQLNKELGRDTKKKKDGEQEKKKALPKNAKSFEQEVTLPADTAIIVAHSKKTKRIVVSLKNTDGHAVKLKWKKMDDNRLKLYNKTDSVLRLKLTVTPKEPLDNKGWYKTAQCVARALMMVRTVSISYRNQYSMSLPGFMPTIGDAFGQTRQNGIMAPGLDFAFGVIDDNYIGKARDNRWLLVSDSIATPATTNKTEDLQLRATLEPIRDLKIDLNASRTETVSKSIQYMYAGIPTTQSGTLTMTTISIGTAFESMGNANNGYHSATFDKFVKSLDTYRNRVEAQYIGANYPMSMGGGRFNPTVGTVNKYSADVMIPAFLNAYTSMGGNGLDIFPKLKSMLPNWTIRYSGLSRLPFFQNIFKSVNINHSYKSIFAIGSYQSFSTWQEYMNGLGFVKDATSGAPIPSSMYNIAQVSINEAFAPLLGIDVTLQNNLTARLEYRQTRILSLSMTSVQVNEAMSKDWVIGFGYRINNVNLFGGRNTRLVKSIKKNSGQQNQQSGNTQSVSNRNNGGINRDLNLRLDLSYRRQASVTRDIATLTSAASSGNTAFKASFIGDYTLSRLITASIYYDIQINTPLLSSSSFPTTTHDFGVSLKLSLTR